MIDERQVRSIVERVLEELARAGHAAPVRGQTSARTGDGIFPTLDAAVAAAAEAQRSLVQRPLADRVRLVDALRAEFRREARRLAEVAVADTGMGRVEDKTTKNLLCANKTFGPEDIQTQSVSGDYGLTLAEYAPYGVIGSITPSTNPVATVINHVIMMISGGNTVVFNPHPGAAGCTLEGIRVANRAITAAGGPPNLATACAEPTLRTAKELMTHETVALLVATGGKAVVRACMETGKKTIAAGPGNPPVIVDETCAVDRAAQSVIDGASFDNNMPCVCEKEAIVLESAAGAFIDAMKRGGCYELTGDEIRQAERLVLTEDGHVNKDWVGQDAAKILGALGLRAGSDCRLVIAQVPESHPFIQLELLMPILGIVRARTFEEAVRIAVDAEHGFRHTAMIHSASIDRITAFARAINCNLFVANGNCGASLGYEAEGHTSMTIAGPTGEGVTRPRTFVRERRLVLKDALHVV